MVNQRFVKLTRAFVGLIIISPIFVSPQIVFGYNDDTTHRALTKESAKIFNYHYPDQTLNESEIESLIKGSFEEDNAPRWLNHFYDPVYNRGLRGLFSSKNWAQNTLLQGLRLPTTTWLEEYFNDPTDYSWERAIYDYVYGDQSRGLEALGHVMHLVQDTTVPDHTRDDMHPLWSTYENYTKRFSLETTNLAQGLIAENNQILIYPNLESYFDQLATFTNNNFFSDDTILIKKYTEPTVIKEKKEQLSDDDIHTFGLNNKGARLVEIEKYFDFRKGKLVENYLINDIDNKIPAGYWSSLSEKAVLGSAGVIKLFFDEVEKEKETGRLFEKNKSLVKRVWEKIGVEIENIKTQFGNLLANAISILPEKLEISLDSNPDSEDAMAEISFTGESESTPEPVEVKKIDESEAKQIAELLAVISNLENRIEKIKQQQSEQSAKTLAASTTQALGTIPSMIYGGGGDNQILNEIIDLATTSENVVVASPSISLPSDFTQIFATSTIVFSGTSSPNSIIFNDFNQLMATTSEQGIWQLVVTDLPQGTTPINFYARDGEGNVSLPKNVVVQIDSLPLLINLSADSCLDSLTSDFCLLVSTSTVYFSWQITKPGDYEYDLLKIFDDKYGEEQNLIATSTSELSSLVETGLSSDNLTTEFRWQILVRSASSSEIIASSSEISMIFHPQPLVINEISWAGTLSSTTDEWIELRNYLNKNIKLDDYYLTDLDETWRLDLSGFIDRESYYLIERGSDEVISNRSAKLAADWGENQTTKSFNLNRVGLKLYRDNRLIDETPFWDKTTSIPGSLERTFENKISTDLSTWEDNIGCNESDGPCALDRSGQETFGTPGVINTASIARLF